MTSNRRGIFLDRDGVVIRSVIREGKPHPPSDWSQFEVIAGAPEAVRRLKDQGFIVVVATNQPDVRRGGTSRAFVDAVNAKLVEVLGVDAISVCEHDDIDGCDCRKPKPGMLIDAAERFGVDLKKSFMVGDRWRDIEAGRAAGCRTILIGSGYGEVFPSAPDFRADSLPAAADLISAFHEEEAP